MLINVIIVLLLASRPPPLPLVLLTKIVFPSSPPTTMTTCTAHPTTAPSAHPTTTKPSNFQRHRRLAQHNTPLPTPAPLAISSSTMPAYSTVNVMIIQSLSLSPMVPSSNQPTHATCTFPASLLRPPGRTLCPDLRTLRSSPSAHFATTDAPPPSTTRLAPYGTTTALSSKMIATQAPTYGTSPSHPPTHPPRRLRLNRHTLQTTSTPLHTFC